jgi:hypothetical protein
MRRCVAVYKAMKGDVADSARATSDGVWQKKHSGCGRMRTPDGVCVTPSCGTRDMNVASAAKQVQSSEFILGERSQ